MLICKANGYNIKRFKIDCGKEFCNKLKNYLLSKNIETIILCAKRIYRETE